MTLDELREIVVTISDIKGLSDEPEAVRKRLHIELLKYTKKLDGAVCREANDRRGERGDGQWMKR